MRSVFVVCIVLALVGQLAQSELSHSKAIDICRQRTGLKEGDIMSANMRNQHCSIDCVTRQGTLMTAYADEGMPCNSYQSGYKCVMGMCRGEDNQLNDEFKQLDLNLVTLHINSAFVADRDPYPGQGESDAFVVVEVASDGKPSYNGSEVVCHTHVVQDSKQPKWNYSCKPLPLRSSTQLRFVVMDSDKPDNQPQLLGRVTRPVEALMNAGPQTLVFESPKFAGGPHWLEVEIKGNRYKPGEE